MNNFRSKPEGSKASEVLQHLQKDINIAASKGYIRTVQRLLKDGADANDKDIDGRTPLHYAVDNGNIDVVSTFLKNGAEVAQITNKGNTPLHTATSKGYKEIVELLLQHISRDKLNDFVNAKTTSGGTTSLHVAAKNGFLEVVKSLLKHGATYNIENKEGKIPFDLSEDQKVTNLLKLIEELFEDTKNGKVESISKLGTVKPDEFLAITNARNNQGNTLLQIAIANKHENIATKLVKMLIRPDQVQSQFITKCELDQLEKLKNAADLHISFSEIYLPMLRSMSQPYSSEKNPFPWRTLKEGSYYLGNAYRLVEVYKDCVRGSIDNKSIQSVNDMLVALEFDPKHITSGYTDEAYGGRAKCFVSKGQDISDAGFCFNLCKQILLNKIIILNLKINKMMVSRGFAGVTKVLESTNVLWTLMALVTVCTLSVNAISCYECNSHLQPECGEFEKLNETRRDAYLVKCSSMLHPQNATAFCRSVELILAMTKEERTIRSCGYAPHKGNYSDLCFNPESEGYTERVCQCMTDRCNSAPRSISFPNVFIACIGIVSLVLGSLY